MKTAKQINDYAVAVIAMIEDNKLEEAYSFEYGLAIDVKEQIGMDTSAAQREYLTDEYFLHGSFTLPTIKGKLTKAIKKLNDEKEGVVVVTPLEMEALDNIVMSEFQSNADVVGCPVWSFSVTNETRRLAGALGSLVKKGLAGCQREKGENEVTWITAAGFAEWEKNELKKKETINQ